MNCLNREKYKELKSKGESKAKEISLRKGFKRNKNESYLDCYRRYIDKDVYNAYINLPCNTRDDLYRIAGIAYSWMPTMLDLYIEEENDWNTLLQQIKEFINNNRNIRRNLVDRLSRVINHSIVGTSKTLHIINPEFAPLIDSRVVRGWNDFFAEEIRMKKIQNLPSSLHWSNNKDRMKKIDKYIEYWDNLLKWKNSLDNKISIRDIEIIFYLLGEPPKRNKNIVK